MRRTCTVAALAAARLTASSTATPDRLIIRRHEEYFADSQQCGAPGQSAREPFFIDIVLKMSLSSSGVSRRCPDACDRSIRLHLQAAYNSAKQTSANATAPWFMSRSPRSGSTSSSSMRSGPEADGTRSTLA